MSLFGAASSGVDPKTGSYLSKEQRVAMFRASRGQGNGGTSGAKNNSSRVDPSSAIVVANRMTSVVQKLQTFNQENVETVSEQVAQNKENLQNLYNNVAADRKDEAKTLRAETVDKRKEKESLLRGAKENLVEGISSAVAAAGNGLQKAGSAALKPIKSYWDRLKQALLLLGAAWVIDNLPAIIDSIKSFDFGNIQESLVKSLTSVRGAWSILDDILGGLKRTVGRVARSTFRFARFLALKTFEVSKKVFTSISTFVWNVSKQIIKKLASIVTDAASAIWKGAKNLAKGGKEILDSGVDAARNSTKGLRNAFNKTPLGKMLSKAGKTVTDFGTKTFKQGKELLSSAKTTVGKGLDNLKTSATGVETKSLADRTSWLKKALQPIVKRFPNLAGSLSKLTGFATNIIRRVPGIGFAIDLALNKGVEGQDWTQAILRSLGSSVVGGLSAAAGAKAGGLAGATVGAAFGGIGAIPGAAIGAGIGAILAGMVGGAAGDKIGAAANEFINPGSTIDNKPIGSGVVDSISGMMDSSTSLEVDKSKEESKPFDFSISGSSGMVGGDDLGLYSLDGGSFDAGGSGVSVIDLPPMVKNMSMGNDTPSGSTEVKQIRNFPSSDPDMEIYRSFARRQYQLVS